MILEKVKEAKKKFEDKNYFECISLLAQAYEVFFEDDFLIEDIEPIDSDNIEATVKMIKAIIDHPIFVKKEGFSLLLSAIEAETLELKQMPDREVFYDLGTWYAFFLAKLDVCFQMLTHNQISLHDYDERQGFVVNCESDESGLVAFNLSKTIDFLKEGTFSSDQEIRYQYSKFESLCKLGEDRSTIRAMYMEFVQSPYHEIVIKASQVLLDQVVENDDQVFGISVHNLLTCMGAANFFLENYEKAIDFYLKALQKGAILEEAEYNVWEACIEIIKATSEVEEKKKWKSFFEERFPASQHTLIVD